MKQLLALLTVVMPLCAIGQTTEEIVTELSTDSALVAIAEENCDCFTKADDMYIKVLAYKGEESDQEYIDLRAKLSKHVNDCGSDAGFKAYRIKREYKHVLYLMQANCSDTYKKYMPGVNPADM